MSRFGFVLEYIKCKAVQNGKNCKSTVVDLSKFDRMSTKELQAIFSNQQLKINAFEKQPSLEDHDVQCLG